MTGDALILFFLKTPEKGAVKSRLAAVLGEDAALELYRSFVLDWQTGRATEWQLPSTPEVDLGRVVRAKLEFYPARDGTKIPMFVRRPAGCDKPAALCPVLVQPTKVLILSSMW